MSNKTDNSQDRLLLDRVAAGDMAAMKALYTGHATAVQRFVATRLHDRFEVQDVVHDTMLDVWRSAHGFQGRSSVRSWILTLARNKVVDHIRRQSRVSLAEPDDTLPSDEPDALSVIAAAEDVSRVRACVHALSPQHRAAVELAFFRELTYGEIAQIEDVPEGTIKTRIFHAKKLLMNCLSRKGRQMGKQKAEDKE